MLMHGEKTYLCSVCGKGFYNNAGLQTHIKVRLIVILIGSTYNFYIRFTLVIAPMLAMFAEKLFDKQAV